MGIALNKKLWWPVWVVLALAAGLVASRAHGQLVLSPPPVQISSNGINNTLGFTPMANTSNAVVTALGFQPGNNSTIGYIFCTNAQTSVTFSNIPQTFLSLMLECGNVTVATNAYADIQVQVNGNTNAVYGRQGVYSAGASSGASIVMNLTSAAIFPYAPATNSIGMNMHGTARFPSYSATNGFKRALTAVSGYNTSDTNSASFFPRAIIMTNVGSITSITLFPSTACPIGAGSEFILTGVPKP